jgi:iron complex outermembrane recepter protein
MAPPTNPTGRMRLRFRRTTILLAAFSVSCLFAAEATKVRFNLPADDADKSLRKFADQSGKEVVFGAEITSGIKTRPVLGEFAPPEAMSMLLSGTGLVAVQDETSGAFMVNRASPPQPSPSKPTTPWSEDTVKMDAFTVTTSLGRYIDSTTNAMKVPVAQLDLPFTVQGLNASFLQDVRTTRLEDSFGYVTGLTKQGPSANAFTLRGFAAAGSNLQSIQLDGLPGPPSRWSSPPTINVERLEVLKGPTSVLYGQANPGGLLNIVTKSPKETRQSSLSTFLSTYDGQTSGFGDAVSWSASLDSTGAIDSAKHLLYRAIVSYEDTNSFRDYYYARNKYFYPSLTYRWTTDTSVTVKGEYVRETRQANDGLAVPFLNVAFLPPINVDYSPPDGTAADSGESLSTQFQTRLLDRWTLRAAYRTAWHTDTNRYFETSGSTVTSATPYKNSTIPHRFRADDNSRRYNFLDANIFGEVGSAEVTHTLIAGINGGKEWFDANRLALGPLVNPVNLYVSVPDVPTAYPTTLAGPQDSKTTSWTYGYYMADQIKIGKYWNAALGWRYSEQDAYQWVVQTAKQSKPSGSKSVPSAGLVFHPAGWFSLYGSYCEGFKPQAPGSVDANDNQNFPPETSEQIEGGIKLDALDHNLSGSVGVYRIKKENVLTASGTNTPAGNPISNLSGLQESQGLELGLAYLPKPNWQVQVGYTYIDARVKTSSTKTIVGAQLDNTSHNSGNLWTRYNVPRGALKGLGIGFGAIYASQRQAIITNVPTARLQLPGYTRLDLGIYYRTKRTDYALNASNLLDRTYVVGAIPGGPDRLSPGDPRKLTFSVRVDL